MISRYSLNVEFLLGYYTKSIFPQKLTQNTRKFQLNMDTTSKQQ